MIGNIPLLIKVTVHFDACHTKNMQTEIRL